MRAKTLRNWMRLRLGVCRSSAWITEPTPIGMQQVPELDNLADIVPLEWQD
jgi:hypothetical protein